MYSLEKFQTLAKVNLNDDEKESATSFFDFWIAKFDLLETINTENVEPLVSVSTMVNVMRDDITFKTTSREELLANAPEEYDGYFVVPKIL